MAVAPATNPILELGIESLTLSWTNSITFGTQHKVYRSRGACGVYVPIISGIQSPFIDYNVSNGEVYKYYIVATVGNILSSESTVVSLTFVGSSDQYKDTLTSQDARGEQLGAKTVYGGTVISGCGEYQRLQQLRGKSFMCGK